MVVEEGRLDQPDGAEQTELERLTIVAIIEHRTLIAAAEAADEALRWAEGDRQLSVEHRASLEAACDKSRLTLTAQQLALNNLIDRLGYIPDVSTARAGGHRLN